MAAFAGDEIASSSSSSSNLAIEVVAIAHRGSIKRIPSVSPFSRLFGLMLAGGE